MPTPTNPSQNENTYFIEAENAAEMARLTSQHRLITKNMGGLFPEQFDLANIHQILDVACGPGGWVLDVARAYPNKAVVGIDISQLMIEYAHMQVQAQGLNNASFKVMNVLEPLGFADGSFDLVNARFLTGFMPKDAWPKLVQECMRITRPGGVIRLTEFEASIANGSAFEQLSGIFTRAMQLAGRSFSPDGRHLAVIPMLRCFLRDAGCTNIKKMAHVIEYSAGTEAYSSMYQDWMVVFKLIQPFLIKMGVTTQEEVEALYWRTLAEMQADDFCGIWFYLSAWGNKP